jgi:hypothetical protein
MTETQSPNSSGEFLLYTTDDGQAKLEVRLVGETVWLPLNQISELFQRDKSVVSRHIKNIFEEGELAPASVVAEYATTANDGKSYKVAHFNLDVIISVGYRVKSHRGTQFRIWSTQRLREFLIKGFAMDDDRLKRAGGAFRIGSYSRVLVPSPTKTPCARPRSNTTNSVDPWRRRKVRWKSISRMP